MSDNESKKEVLALISARTSVDEKAAFVEKCEQLKIVPSTVVRMLVDRWVTGEIKLEL